VSFEEDEVEDYSKFYRENVGRLVTFLVFQGVPLADAADCVQETLIDALPPVWATLEHPYAWCRLVAYRKSCKLRDRRDVPTEDFERVGAALIAPEANLDAIDQNVEIVRLLSLLKGARQRQVLAWTYDGAKPLEIAAELDMSPATVRTTLRDVRSVLRALYAEEGEIL
jgi:RNA polymerase sigma-70 factor (ECF subfamily)